MNQKTRIFIGVVILVVIVTVVLGVDALRRSSGNQSAAGTPTTMSGDIPIYLDGKLMGAFTSPDLGMLEQVSFVDAEEGKTQEGWLLRDVLLLHVKERVLKADTAVVVISTSREKSAELTWAEVEDPANWVMFDVSGRGTLKLVSVLERLDVRDEWIQDVDKIEILSAR